MRHIRSKLLKIERQLHLSADLCPQCGRRPGSLPIGALPHNFRGPITDNSMCVKCRSAPEIFIYVCEGKVNYETISSYFHATPKRLLTLSELGITRDTPEEISEA